MADAVDIHRRKVLDYQRANPEKYNAKARRHYWKHRERKLAESRDYQLRQNYGITSEMYAQMMASQGGRCAICEKPQTEFKRRFHVDHDHKTGVVRGLLCSVCNTSLAAMEKDEGWLSKALAYLGES